ncbi:MAG: glycosyl transferase family 1 [Bacteroidetes bacterium HGW-Bacteroidetes-1]|nr:MAG: glycosyl transferase family 1 [Bacteroidetes bacterium HGW-Bacteroidetes-1]
MKKVLIITYYWPPSGGAGVQRWLKFVKYLRDFCWEPIIYTPENPEVPVIDSSLIQEIPSDITILKTKVWEPYHFYKRFTGRKKDERIQTAFLTEKKKSGLTEKISVWIRGNLFIPDARKFWIKPSVHFLKKWMGRNKVDLIVSTGPPHSMHLIAHKLKECFDIPWLADFRDPWTNIDFYKDLQLTHFADLKHRNLEKTVLQRADEISVISEGMRKDFNKIVPRHYHVITNGFDDDDFNNLMDITGKEKFTLAHIGSLVKTRNPLNLWRVLGELVNENASFAKDLDINLTGKVDFSVKQSIEEAGLTPFAHIIDYVPHNEVILTYNKASILLLLINNTPNAPLILTGKFFEYMAAKKPIICIGPVLGDAANILKETKTGVVYSFEETDALKKAILSIYHNFKSGKPEFVSSDIEKFSRKNLTKKLTELMDVMVIKTSE